MYVEIFILKSDTVSLCTNLHISTRWSADIHDHTTCIYSRDYSQRDRWHTNRWHHTAVTRMRHNAPRRILLHHIHSHWLTDSISVTQQIAVLCGMSTIQYSAQSVRSFIIYGLSPFRHVAVWLCRRFDHTPTSSGHAHLDRQRYDMACSVGRRREFERGFLYGSYSPEEWLWIIDFNGANRT